MCFSRDRYPTVSTLRPAPPRSTALDWKELWTDPVVCRAKARQSLNIAFLVAVLFPSHVRMTEKSSLKQDSPQHALRTTSQRTSHPATPNHTKPYHATPPHTTPRYTISRHTTPHPATPHHTTSQEEIFGPVLPVMTVSSVEQAIAFCRPRPTPLAAYVFERNPAVGEKWLKEVASGGACVNDCIVHMYVQRARASGVGSSEHIYS